MRIKANDPRLDGKNFRVWIDGVEQNAVMLADDEQGVIERYMVFDDGTISELFTETLRGTVRIEEWHVCGPARVVP